MTLTQDSAVLGAIRTAEDGLDPADALTPVEALARIVWLLRKNKPAIEGYEAEPGICALMDWGNSEKGSVEAATLRTRLEDKRLVSRWATS